MTRYFCAILLGVFVLCDSACDEIWRGTCAEDASTPGCSATLNVASAGLWCGQQSLDLRVTSNADVSAQLAQLAPTMTATLRMDGQDARTLGPPVFQSGVLRVALSQQDLPPPLGGSGSIDLQVGRGKLTAHFSYGCARRKFVQPVVQPLSLASSNIVNLPVKFGGLFPDAANPPMQALTFASCKTPDCGTGHFDYWKLVGKKITVSSQKFLDLNVANFAAVSNFYINRNGYLVGNADDNNNYYMSSNSNANYAVVSPNLFGKPLLSASGSSDLVATNLDINNQTQLRPSLAVDSPLWSTLGTEDVEALAIGAFNGSEALIVAQADGSVVVVKTAAQGTMAQVDSASSNLLSQRLTPQRANVAIAALALADVNNDNLTDVLVLQRATSAQPGGPAQIGIIYGAVNGQFEEWTPLPIEEDPALLSAILTQDIERIELGLLDNAQFPNLVIATKSEVRVYQNVSGY